MPNSKRITKNLQQEPTTWLCNVASDGRKYDSKKASSERVGVILSSSPYERGKRQGKRVAECSEFVYGKLKSDAVGDVSFHVTRSNRCHVRLCPTCAWLKSRKRKLYALSRLAPLIEENNKKSYKQQYQFIFLTLTQKNCSVYDLNAELTRIAKGFDCLMKRRTVKRHIAGYIKGVETTHKPNMMAHPHMHVILMVKPSYFEKRKPIFSTSDWVRMWRESLRLDYDPICDIRAIRPNTKKGMDALSSAIQETLKYLTKYDERLLDDPSWLCEFNEQIHGRRLLGSGGLLKDVIKEDMTEEEMDAYIESLEDGEFMGSWFFNWYKSHKRYGC